VQQSLGEREVADGTASQRLEGDHRLVALTGRLPRFLPHRQHLAGALVERDEGGLA
jgi:hypothetical protein